MLLPDRPNVYVPTKSVQRRGSKTASVTTAVLSSMILTLLQRFRLAKTVEVLRLFRVLMLLKDRVLPAFWGPLLREPRGLERTER
jgi:hypothetical protein